MKKLFFLSITVILISCESSPEQEDLEISDETEIATSPAVVIQSSAELEVKKHTLIQLPIGTIELEDDPFFKENHYGSFFNDQLSCYVVDTPEGEIAGTPVSKVVLFYIDQVLYKKKYILESNPIGQIKPEIKKFRIKSLTMSRKVACKDKSNKECADYIIAQNQFQFSWKKDNLDYQLYNWESEDETEIILTEKRGDYKEALRFA
ncbi:MAG: hypothetical protein AB8B73_09135, partial [Ekhidna sp.]